MGYAPVDGLGGLEGPQLGAYSLGFEIFGSRAGF